MNCLGGLVWWLCVQYVSAPLNSQLWQMESTTCLQVVGMNYGTDRLYSRLIST